MLHSSQRNSRFISITIAITDFSNTPGVSPEAKLPPIFSQSEIIGSESIHHPRYLLKRFLSPKPDHQLIEENHGVIHDQLRCCLWIPRTNNKPQQHTHTRSKTETDEALSESTQNQGRLFQLIRILQWKINASDKQNCHQPQLLTVQNHIRGIKVLNTNTLMHQANSVSDKL